MPALCADVVVLDLRMPGGDGLEAAQQIKAAQPSVRVLAFTAVESIPAMLRAYEAGADAYLEKGVGADKFFETLRRIAAGECG